MKKNGETVKNNESGAKKGVTLIALVITVIVLMILATITVNSITGNGIITNTEKAKENAEIEAETKVIVTATNQAKSINKYGELSKEALVGALNATAGIGETDVAEIISGFSVTFVKSNRVYEIENDGDIEYIGYLNDALIIEATPNKSAIPNSKYEIEILVKTFKANQINTINYLWSKNENIEEQETFTEKNIFEPEEGAPYKTTNVELIKNTEIDDETHKTVGGDYYLHIKVNYDGKDEIRKFGPYLLEMEDVYLEVDPNGGMWAEKENGTKSAKVQIITGKTGESKEILEPSFEKNYTVKFKSDIGFDSDVLDKNPAVIFDRWNSAYNSDSNGKIIYDSENAKSSFIFGSEKGKIIAQYKVEPITLPDATKGNYRLEGWYNENKERVGTKDQQYTPTYNKKLEETLTANWVDGSEPIVTVARKTYNSFDWTATDNTGITGWKVTTTNSKPKVTDDDWVTTGTLTSGTYTNVSTTEAKTYYFWAKDEDDNVNNTPAIIQSYIITRNQEAGTVLYTRVDSTSSTTGTEMSQNIAVLKGTPIWAKAETNSENAVTKVKIGETVHNESEVNETINQATTISSIRTAILAYNANGKGTAPSSVTMNYASETKAANAISTEGYIFEGWNTASDGSGTSYAPGDTVKTANTVASNITLYAQWTGKTYEIALNNQSATTAGTTKLYELYGTGIYLDSGKTKAMTSSANPITKPERKYTVTYNYNGATGGNSSTSATATYTFGGYYTSTGGTGTKRIENTGYINETNFKNTSYSSSGTLYAKWTGGSVTLPTPTKTGYTFGGWYSNSGLTTSAGAGGASYVATSNITLYAKWTANKYTVSFNANGGTGGQSGSKTATYNAAMPSISTTKPTRKGYTFMGWYDKSTYTASGAKQYYTAAGASARNYDKTSNTTLYAGWKAHKLTIQIYPNGATHFGSQTMSALGYNDSTVLFTATYDYGTTDNALVGGGLPNYGSPSAKIPITKTEYGGTGFYHVGSSSKTINGNTTFATVNALASAAGVLSNLETGDVTVKLYAGWDLANFKVASPSFYTITLNGAVDVANDGTTITVLRDVTDASVVTINKNVTINLNNNLFYKSKTQINVTAGKTIIKGPGRFARDDLDSNGTDNAHGDLILMSSTGSVSIESNVYISSYGNVIRTAQGATGKINMDNSGCRSEYKCGLLLGDSGSVTINNSSIVSRARDARAIYVNPNGNSITVTIDGSSIISNATTNMTLRKFCISSRNDKSI